MCKFFPCIPIFRAFFLLKSVKRVCICDYDKNRIVTCEKCIFRFEWGISEKVCQVAQKHTANVLCNLREWTLWEIILVTQYGEPQI